MVETAHLHTKHTGDNSDFKAKMRESIGLVDSYGKKLTANQAKEASSANAAQSRAQSVVAAAKREYNERLRLSGRMTVAYSSEKMGIDQLVAAGNRLQAGLKATTVAQNNHNTAVRQSRFHTGNLAAQIHDIGVMTISGQSPLILAAQQGTQVSQAFNAMGATTRTVFPAIVEAFKQVANPLSILTIGVIAGGVALAQWGINAWKARDAGSDYKDQLEQIEEKLKSGREQLDMYAEGLSTVEGLYVQREINRLLEERRSIEEQITNTEETRQRGSSNVLQNLRAQLLTVNEQIQLETDRRDELEGQASAIESARERSARLLEIQKQLAGLGVETPAEKLKAALQEAETFAGNLLQNMLGIFEAGSSMASQNQAQRDIEVGKVADQYAQYGAGRSAFDSRIQAGMGDVTGGIRRPTSRAGRTGRGAADTTGADLARIQGELMSPAEKAEADFKAKQEVVEKALEQERITQAEHDGIMSDMAKRHQDNLMSIERAAWDAKMSGWAGAFGDLAALAQSENEKMAAVGRAAAAVQIGIDGVRAASAAWQKGMSIGGPPVAAVFAAMSVAKTAALLQQATQKQPNPSAAFGGSSGGGSTAGAAPSSAAEQVQRPQVSLTLIGEQSFTRSQIVQIVEAINDSSDDGSLPINLRGRR